MSNYTTDKIELGKILKEVWGTKFDYNTPIPERPEYIFELENNGNFYGVCLPGSIIEVSGLSKSRKSSLISVFAAAALSEQGKALNVVSKVEGLVLWIDTEQNDTEFKHFQRKIHRLAKLNDNHERYFAYNIRRYDELTRLDIVEATLDKLHRTYGKIGMIVLDGVADFAYNANEQEPTKKLVTQVCSWADNYESAVFTAIHTNKDGKSSTGALGGFLDKKCSYHMRTEMDYGANSPTTVYSREVRSGEGFPPFTFIHGVDGLPALDSGFAMFGEEGEDPKITTRDFLAKKTDDLPF